MCPNRELLTLIAACALLGCSDPERGDAKVDANAYAIDTARDLRQQIRDTQKCPATIEGWEWNSSSRALFKRFGNQGFHLYFECDEDLSFVLSVKYDLDSGTYYTGAPEKAIKGTYGHFTDPTTIEVRDTIDARSLAEQVVR